MLGIWQLLAGFVGPAACIVYSACFHATIFRPFQSGLMHDYAALLLAFPAIGWFLPLILLSMVSLAIMVTRPDRACSIWVRLGIYSGAVLSLQFLIIVHLSLNLLDTMIWMIVFGLFSLAFVPMTCFLWGLKRAIRHGAILRATAMAFLAASMPVLPRLVFGFDGANGIVEGYVSSWQFCWFLLCFATPALNFICYSILAIQLAVREPDWWQQRPRLIPGAFTWFLLLLVSWRQALQTMHSEYLELPLKPPPACFISAAAACGHQRLVGSWETTAPLSTVRVNRQMQYLKFLEFALAAAWPTVHRRVRRIYNQFGPPMANWIRRSPWRADIAWLLLVPFAAFAAALRAVSGVPASQVRRLYVEKCDVNAVRRERCCK
jgi:hypothetical protein